MEDNVELDEKKQFGEDLKTLITDLQEVVSEVHKLPEFIKDLENQRILYQKDQDIVTKKMTVHFELIAHILMFFVPELDPSGESKRRTQEEQIKELRIICLKLNQYFVKNVLFRIQTNLDSKEFLQYMTVCESFCLQNEKLMCNRIDSR
ncbi:hypothetical protein [Enterococcus hirae]|uniref:hypothetical protein n=1 Tax=Enterococcus hirae TaxID=1354 RepID=UPI001377BE57|nr:hypothetical protein [Enterococcus hirae]NBA40362.1 hypothetical protein [Enterococcus hirae]NBA56581.1 hypothetical protein [Enterococcus hirae]